MTDGFKAINQDGIFQIDGETLNFQLVNRQSGTAQQTSLQTDYSNAGVWQEAVFWSITFNFIANTPLVAFRASDGSRISPWSFARSGNSYSATFITNGPCNVIMWVFDQAAATNDNFGMKIYNSSGQLVCSAIQPFAKVVDVIFGQYIPGSGFYAGGGQMPGNNPQTRQYAFPVAFAACYPCHYMFGTGTDGETDMSGLMTFNGSTAMQWEWFVYGGARSGNYVGFLENTAYRFLVLDMTGID